MPFKNREVDFTYTKETKKQKKQKKLKVPTQPDWSP